MTYSPNTSPVDVDIVNDRVQLRSNVVVLAFWKDYVTSSTTFAERFEDVGDVVGRPSVGKDGALRSVAMVCVMDTPASGCQWEDERNNSPEG